MTVHLTLNAYLIPNLTLHCYKLTSHLPNKLINIWRTNFYPLVSLQRLAQQYAYRDVQTIFVQRINKY